MERRGGVAFWALLVLCLGCLGGTLGSMSAQWLNPATVHQPHFSSDCFSNATAQVGMSDMYGRVASFGDVDNDQYTDIFVISDDQLSVIVYQWSPYDWKFSIFAIINETYPIVNVAPSDFNHDGWLDFLVTCNEEGNGFLSLHLYLRNRNSSNHWSFRDYIDLYHADDQVLLFDWNSDMLVDLLGISDGTTVVWLNNGNDTFSIVSGELPLLSSPHSASFVDLDGDCHPDLFLTTTDGTDTFFEMWIWNRDDSRYSRQRKFTAPEGAGQVLFIDFDRDAAIDMVFPVNNNGQAEIWIAYNSQMKVCSGLSGGDNCLSSSSMCTAFPDFLFSLSDPTNESLVVVPLPTPFFIHPDFPLTVHAGIALKYGRLLGNHDTGDYDIDGFPDLLISVQNVSVSIQLWKNTKCSSSANCSDAQISAGTRTLVRNDAANIKALTDINGAYAAAFFDIGDGGSLDILVLVDPSVVSMSGKSRVEAVFNGFEPDALFFKTVVLNGVCDVWCKEGETVPDPKPYGVNQPGGVVKLTFTDTGGHNLGVAGTQLSQSSYLSLLPPYLFFGLGRVSNYISTAFCGIPMVETWTQYFESIVPNSQVVFVTFPPSNVDRWKMELYITATGVLFWVIIALVLALGGLGGIILWYRWKEKEEDKKEEKAPVSL